jgi:hypothetical protein
MGSRHFHHAGILLLAVLVATGCQDVVTTGRAAAADAQQSAEPVVALPNKEGSVKFGVLGDFGTGAPSQYQLADQMVKLHGGSSTRSW